MPQEANEPESSDSEDETEDDDDLPGKCPSLTPYFVRYLTII